MDAAIVAVESVALDGSMVLIVDEELSRQVDRPAIRIWKSVGKTLGSHKPLIAFTTALAALAIVASAPLKVDHSVIATGPLEPAAIQNVFAGVDGIVTHLHVRDGDQVCLGQMLLK